MNVISFVANFKQKEEIIKPKKRYVLQHERERGGGGGGERKREEEGKDVGCAAGEYRFSFTTIIT